MSRVIPGEHVSSSVPTLQHIIYLFLHNVLSNLFSIEMESLSRSSSVGIQPVFESTRETFCDVVRWAKCAGDAVLHRADACIHLIPRRRRRHHWKSDKAL